MPSRFIEKIEFAVNRDPHIELPDEQTCRCPKCDCEIPIKNEFIDFREMSQRYMKCLEGYQEFIMEIESDLRTVGEVNASNYVKEKRKRQIAEITMIIKGFKKKFNLE